MSLPRPPVVAILGHVDHGKTTLLDYIRKSNLTLKEHGGITQKIGAYEITTDCKDYEIKNITFIDTPGHEAFSKLRSRGAHVADIAILVVDAKDSLKPQTVESIQHIKEAKIPFIVALNKTDLPESNPQKVIIDLMKHEIIVEEKGGDVPCIKISAKTGHGVNDLLENILFIASEKKFSYEEEAEPEVYIIETKRDKRGIVASIILKNGVLTVGDELYSGKVKVKVKGMIDDKGKQCKKIFPSSPVEILGFEDLPEVGTLLTSKEGEENKNKQMMKKQQTLNTFEALFASQTEKKQKKLDIVLKADSHGSLEAILEFIKNNENINLLSFGIGNIHSSDIFLAKTSKAFIIGFNVNPDSEAKNLAKQEKVLIKTYSIIYELIDELQEVSELLLEKERQEKNLKGEAKVLATFIIEGQTIYGVRLNKGKMKIGDNIEIYRNGELFIETKLVSLKNRAKTIQEIKKDQEGGMIFDTNIDIKIGDIVKSIL